MKDYLSELPPELILLLSPSLSTASLNALTLTSRRIRQILQPKLESRITPQLGEELLLWASASKPHIVAKLLAPPYSIHPSPGNGVEGRTALHVAAMAGNLEIANLLLQAGANPAASWSQDECQPLHFAAMNKNLAMMKLLLDHGAPLEHRFGLCDQRSANALHQACILGHMEMVKLLLERGAQLEAWGHYGTPLGFAIHAGNVEVVRFLLEKGADANVTVPLFVLITASDAPTRATPLYVAMGLRHPRCMLVAEGRPPERWEGLPLCDRRKQLMALLMAYGASKEGVMATITQYVKPLAEAALYSEEEYLQIIAGMFKEAEEAIPEVVG